MANSKIIRDALGIARADFENTYQEVLSLYSGGKFMHEKKKETSKHYGPGPHRSGSSQAVHGSGETRVGLTSARPGKPSREVFRDMGKFEDELKQIKGVGGASVRPGVGMWEGTMEPTWVISYKGNGDARRLVASKGRQYNQDGALMFYSSSSKYGQKALGFDGGFKSTTKELRRFVEQSIIKHGSTFGIMGTTWRRVGGQTQFFIAQVPQFGVTSKQFRTFINGLNGDLRGLPGYNGGVTTNIRVEFFSGETYDEVIGS